MSLTYEQAIEIYNNVRKSKHKKFKIAEINHYLCHFANSSLLKNINNILYVPSFSPLSNP